MFSEASCGEPLSGSRLLRSCIATVLRRANREVSVEDTSIVVIDSADKDETRSRADEIELSAV
jgi:hypothetical protein